MRHSYTNTQSFARLEKQAQYRPNRCQRPNITDIIYVNFEDERILPLRAEELHLIVDAYSELYGDKRNPFESECDRGHWHVLKADTETLFDKKSSEIWQELIQQVSVKWVRTINSGN